MPVYDYRCPDCGDFSRLRPMSARSMPAECHGCGAASPRVFVAAPMGSSVDAAGRAAGAANERSANEPLNLATWRSRHGSGCGCCRPGSAAGAGLGGAAGRGATAGRNGAVAARGGAIQAANGLRAFAGRRPWQISH